MIRPVLFAWLPALAAVLTLPGCRLIEPNAAAKGQLAPLAASTESVTLEIFFAHCAAGSAPLNGALWDEVDEQALPAELRRELAQNGLRVGMVGTHVPVELARLLTLTDAPLKHPGENTVNLEAEPTVSMRLLSIRSGRRSEIVTSHTYDSLPLLTREAGQVVGRTYSGADCRFALRATTQKDGRVEVELLPEVHYGQQQQRWNAVDGVIRLEAARPKRVFEELRLKTELVPGQMLIVTCQPDRPGTLGHHFFTEPKADSLVQKVVIVRLAQAGPDRSFSETVSGLRDEAVDRATAAE